MAIAPPMNDSIKLNVILLDEEGNPAYDRYGREQRVETTTNARVKYSGEEIYSASGNRTVAVLEIRVPATVVLSEDDEVLWVDPHQRVVSGKVAKVEDVLNYPGVVQFRKVWTKP